MTTPQKLEILAFTDPVCTWCWGAEPVLRKLTAVYGAQITIRPVMGGLVEDIRGFYDQANRIGGDPVAANAQIARHWLEASERHGMPVEVGNFRMFDDEIVSTYPQNIAFKAVELCAPDLAARFLRRMREAVAAEGLQIGRRDVLIGLATEVGVDPAAFAARLDDGSAEAAFRADLALTRSYAVRGFPTFLVRYGANEILLRGFQTFRKFQTAIASASEGRIRARPPEPGPNEILRFLQQGRAAPAELVEVFDLTPEALTKLLRGPDLAGQVLRVPAGNGLFWQTVPEGESCDVLTGICG